MGTYIHKLNHWNHNVSVNKDHYMKDLLKTFNHIVSQKKQIHLLKVLFSSSHEQWSHCMV